MLSHMRIGVPSVWEVPYTYASIYAYGAEQFNYVSSMNCTIHKQIEISEGMYLLSSVAS